MFSGLTPECKVGAIGLEPTTLIPPSGGMGVTFLVVGKVGAGRLELSTLTPPFGGMGVTSSCGFRKGGRGETRTLDLNTPFRGHGCDF